jgi:ribosomally synthesized peptide
VYREPLERIIGRAAMDLGFRKKMFENPEKALEEYNLTEEQVMALKAISTDALEKFAHKLGQSIEEGRREPKNTNDT